jgi:putative hydrolase of the HAD superfamily
MIRLPVAILFDLDDTLISFDGVTRQAWNECYEDFMARHKPGFSLDALGEAVRAAQDWYWGDPVRHKAGRENIRLARREVVGVALNGLGIRDTEIVNDLADRYSDRHDELIHLYPNTLPTLDALKSAGVRLSLITNGSAKGQRAKLARFGLTDYFEHILIDQELGFGKPDVRVYEHALKLMGLDSRDVWMVGDNLVWDIEPPKALGIRAVWHDWKGAGLPEDAKILPDRIIADIGELIGSQT